MGPWLRAFLTALAAVGLAALLWRRPNFGPDFLVFWNASQHLFDAVYAFKAAPGQPGPLVYPPPFLLLLLPISLLTAQAAFLIWVGASTAAYIAAGDRLARKFTPLVMLSPPVVFAAATGQTTLLIGAALMAGLSLMSRPILAGVLLGAALSLKPQVAFLAPLGLLFSGQWKALAAMAVTAVGLGAVTSLIFGPTIWLDWLRTLPAFMRLGAERRLVGVSLAPDAGPVLRALLILGGAALTWRAFRQEDVATRIIVAVGASLACSPHAQGYDTGLLAPAALALLLRRSWSIAPSAAFLLGYLQSPLLFAAFVIVCGSGVFGHLDRAFPVPAVRWPFRTPSKAAD